MKEELLKGLTEDQIAKIKECKSNEEMLALAKQEGVQLSDEQLEAVSGGCTSTLRSEDVRCPACGSGERVTKIVGSENKTYCRCYNCGNEWEINKRVK